MIRVWFIPFGKNIHQRKKPKNSINYAIIVSGISLLLSLATFYVTQLQVVHSLKVTFIQGNRHPKGDSASLVYRAVFQNIGNRPEVVVNTSIFLAGTCGKLMSQRDTFHVIKLISDTTFIVPKNDVSISEYQFQIRVRSLEKYKALYHVMVEYRVTGRDSIETTYVHLAKLHAVENHRNDRKTKYLIIVKDLTRGETFELIDN